MEMSVNLGPGKARRQRPRILDPYRKLRLQFTTISFCGTGKASGEEEWTQQKTVLANIIFCAPATTAGVERFLV